MRVPATLGVKLTWMLHDVWGASAAVHALKALKSPLVVTPEMFRGAFPLLVRVATCDDVVPTFCALKGRPGVRTAMGAMPVPVRRTLSGDDALLLETVRAPLAAPIAVGAKLTSKVQLVPGATVAGQLLV